MLPLADGPQRPLSSENMSPNAKAIEAAISAVSDFDPSRLYRPGIKSSEVWGPGSMGLGALWYEWSHGEPLSFATLGAMLAASIIIATSRVRYKQGLSEVAKAGVEARFEAEALGSVPENFDDLLGIEQL